MRAMVQRFAALAMVIALVFGMVGSVSAQNQDSGTVTASSTTVAALRLTVENPTATFGSLDAYGLNATPAGITKCALDTPTSTTYATNTPTIVKVVSTTGYNVTAVDATGDSNDFVVFLGGQCSTDRLTFNQADQAVGPVQRLSGTATGRAGTSSNLYIGAIITIDNELTRSSSLSFTFRASAV